MESTNKSKLTLIPIEKNNLWGYANLNGEIIIEPKFLEVKLFHGDYAIVCNKKIPQKNFFNAKYGDVIHQNIKNKLECYSKKENYAITNGLINVAKYDAQSYKNIDDYTGGWDKIWGIINIKGEFVVEPIFYTINMLGDGIMIGKIYLAPSSGYHGDYCGNRYYLLNFKNNNYTMDYPKYYFEYLLFSNQFWFLTSGKSPVGKDYCFAKNIILNNNGIEILEINGPSIISDFENGIIKINQQNRTSFYNEKGELIAYKEIDFENISKNFDGNYFFKIDNKYYHFNINDNITKEIDYKINLNDNLFKSKIFTKTTYSY